MKRFLIYLLLPLLLAGCSKPPVTGTEPSSTPTSEPPGFYVPGSELEQSTSGAVRYYPLDENTYSRILPMGDDLLLISKDNSRLTLVTGSNLVPVVEKELSFHVQHIQTDSEGAVCWDEQNRSIVLLSTTLRETSRIRLPEDSIGKPWLTEDWKAIYYCTASGLQRLNLDSGITQLVTSQNSDAQSVAGIYLNDSVVRCDLTAPDKTVLTRMISTTNGEILWEGTSLCEILSAGENWFARVDRGTVQELLFNREDTIRNLWLEDTFSGIAPLPSHNSILTYQEASWGTQIHCYDLTTGLHTASVQLEGICNIRSICPDVSGDGIWLLAQNNALGTNVICHWSPDACPSTDTKDYTQPHFTKENPDAQGLMNIRTQLQPLEQRYNISFLIHEDLSTPAELSVESEHLVPAFQKYLPILEDLLAEFPEDFFASAAQKTPSGKIHIALVRSFQREISDIPVLHYRQNGDIYLIIQMNEDLTQNFYHSVSHMIETRLLSVSAALYDWDMLNPTGFLYANDYRKNLDRDGSQYLQGANRGFVDQFSMSFEREDRARILEYACIPGNEALFQCKILQQKLQMLCAGIREAFNLNGDTYIWEQYLAPTE